MSPIVSDARTDQAREEVGPDEPPDSARHYLTIFSFPSTETPLSPVVCFRREANPARGTVLPDQHAVGQYIPSSDEKRNPA